MPEVIATQTVIDIDPSSDAPPGWLPEPKDREFPSRFADLKARIIPKAKTEDVIKAWNEIIAELAVITSRFNLTQQRVSVRCCRDIMTC